MKDSRRPFRAAEIVGEQRMNAERLAFTERMAKLVAKHATGDQFTAEQYMLIKRDMAGVMDEFYGSHPGDESARFYRAITEGADAARRIAIAQDQKDTEALVKRYKNEIEEILGTS